MIALGYAGFLVGAAAISVPVVLHLIRNKPKASTPFPAFNFLTKTVISLHARNRLRKLLVLLLRCLAIALLALAFCLPYFPAYSGTPAMARVILVDNSLSMSALPYKNEMHEKVLRAIELADRNRPAVVGLAGDSVRFSEKFTTDSNELKAFYLKNDCRGGAAKLGKALMEANALLEGINAEYKEIVVITDRQKLPWQDLPVRWKASPGVKLQLVSPKESGFKNACVRSLIQEKAFTCAGETIPFRVTVQNYADTACSGKLVVRLNSKTVLEKPVSIAEGSPDEISFSLKAGSLSSKTLTVSLMSNDDIPEDNVYYHAITPTKAPTIALSESSSANGYIRCCFCGKEGKQIAQTCSLDQADSDGANLSIFSSAAQLDAKTISALAEKLRKGGNLVVVWDGSFQMRSFLKQFGVEVESPATEKVCYFSSIDFNNPLFKKFLEVKLGSLYSIPFDSPPVVRLPDNAQVIATFTGGTPAISEIPAGSGIILFIASQLDRKKSGWPLHTSFLPVMREILLQYGATQKETETLCCGDCLEQHEGEKVSFNGKELTGQQVRLLKPGFYEVMQEDDKKIISVNVDTRESLSETMPAGFNLKENQSVEEKVSQENPTEMADKSPESYWRVLLGAALIAAVGSLLLANRTTL